MIDEITLGYERLRQPKTLSCLVGDINPTLGNLTARVQQLDDAVKQRLRAPAPGKIGFTARLTFDCLTFDQQEQ